MNFAEELFLTASAVHQKTYKAQLEGYQELMKKEAEKGNFYLRIPLDAIKCIPEGFYLSFFQNQGLTCSKASIKDDEDPSWEKGTPILEVFWKVPNQ